MLARGLSRLSACIAWVEKMMLIMSVFAIFFFVLLNVVLRVFGITIAWADEVAIYAMILSGFFGASLMLRARIDPAVLLVHEFAPPFVVRMLRAVVAFVSMLFGMILFYLCWLWFDPLALISAGFDIPTFEGMTFNFIYTDTTPVLGMPVVYLYLVMPWFALTLTVHAAANLAEDLGLVVRPNGLLSELQGGEG